MRSTKLVWLSVFMVWIWSCVSFKIAIPDEPELVVDYTAILKEIDKTKDFTVKIESEAIQASDRAVFALIKVLTVSKPAVVQWSWYDPQGNLAKKSQTIEVNAQKKYLEYFVAWDVMLNSHFKDLKGKWTVAITVNGLYLTKIEFQVN